MNYSSRLLENAVDEFARLPGVGPKTALRLALHLLRQEEEDVRRFSESIIRLRTDIRYCRQCGNLSDHELCPVCLSEKRDRSQICVVEDTRDVMAIENTAQFQGLYHVLGGLISPMNGVGPSDLRIDLLLKRVQEGTVKEVILALSATMEGDTTIFYIYKKLKEYDIKLTTIAKGISFGGELEYVDEVTLGRSILSRVPYENSLFK